MKITIYSNYLNHHQLPICLELYKQLGNDFVFCANEPVPQYRLDVGWDNMNDQYPFVLKKYESKKKERTALKLAESSDIIILGESSNDYKFIRVKNKKFFFRETERLLKSPLKLHGMRSILVSLWRRFHAEKNSLLLCMGAYTYRDLFLVGCYWNRALKFGYFPTVPKIDIDRAINEKEKNSFIWVGRFINWKHPEYLIKLANYLKFKKIQYKITMVGTGELFDKIKQEIFSNQLADYINLVGPVNHKDVFKYMIKHQFHLFTSDREEGWGAVLNESMYCGCIPLGNKKIGSVPYLIKKNHNGFIYNNTYNSFQNHVLKAINLNDESKYKLAKNAYYTIKNEWNAEEAAREIIRISKCKLNHEKVKLKKDGVLSKA